MFGLCSPDSIDSDLNTYFATAFSCHSFGRRRPRGGDGARGLRLHRPSLNSPKNDELELDARAVAAVLEATQPHRIKVLERLRTMKEAVESESMGQGEVRETGYTHAQVHTALGFRSRAR